MQREDDIGTGRDYVNTGIFPKELGRRIARAENIRHASDYDDFYIVKISEVDAVMATADELIRLVTEYIHQNSASEDAEPSSSAAAPSDGSSD